MRLLFIFIVLLPVIFSQQLFAQAGKAHVDSLLGVLPNMKEDTIKVSVLAELSKDYAVINPDEGVKYAQQGVDLGTRLGWKSGIARSLEYMGDDYIVKGDYAKATDLYNKSLEIYKSIGFKSGIASVMTELGTLYGRQGNYLKSLPILLDVSKIWEELGDKRNLANVTNNIGNIFESENDQIEALNYFLKAKKLAEETGNQFMFAMIVGNIGRLYAIQHKYEESLQYYLDELKVDNKIGDQDGISIALSSISYDYLQLGNFRPSMEYAEKALKVAEAAGDKAGKAAALYYIGCSYLDSSAKTGKPARNIPMLLAKSTENMEKSLALYRETNDLEGIANSLESLSKAYFATNDYRKAYLYAADFHAIRDSLFTKENDETVLKMGMKYDFDKQRLSDSLKTDAKEKITHVQLQRQRSYTYIGIAGVLLLFGVTVLITRNNRLLSREKKKTEVLFGEVQEKNHEINLNLDEIKQKNKEITDNINYAQRIQNAILPDIKLIYKALEQSFILFLPKDIVSGDFYAFAEKNNKVIIIAADCTGHGVSGAFMSMIGSSLLNQIINEKGIDQPDLILNELNVSIIEALKQSETDFAAADGMDISICAFDLQKKLLDYAGANRPLWLVRNNELLAFKADKFPIGGLQAAPDRTFRNNEIQLQEHDTVYIFSDGFADQFGGENGKKMMTSRFKDVLISIQQQDMWQQEQHLKNYFEQWKGAHEQVDDVLVIGVRV